MAIPLLHSIDKNKYNVNLTTEPYIKMGTISSDLEEKYGKNYTPEQNTCTLQALSCLICNGNKNI